MRSADGFYSAPHSMTRFRASTATVSKAYDRRHHSTDAASRSTHRRPIHSPRVFACTTATGPAERLEETDASERELTWSPDGRRAAFVSRRDDWFRRRHLRGRCRRAPTDEPAHLTPRIDTSPEIEPQSVGDTSRYRFDRRRNGR